MNKAMLIELIDTITDYPKPGIVFKDINPILFETDALKYSIDEMINLVQDIDFDYVVGIDARGFIFSSCVALTCKKGLVQIKFLFELQA
jgi:adenine phosphoribosyltransferase